MLVITRILCVIYGRMYPGSNVNFATYAENDSKINRPYDVKVGDRCPIMCIYSFCSLSIAHMNSSENEIESKIPAEKTSVLLLSDRTMITLTTDKRNRLILTDGSYLLIVLIN
jgi:hypothetical protein